VQQRDLLRRYLDAGIAFTEMTRARAEGIVKELVRAGEVQREGFQSQVDDLLQRSRRNTEQLRGLVRQEITTQLSQLGLATKDDLNALERRLTERFGGAAKKAAKKKATAPASKARAKRAPASTKKASSSTEQASSSTEQASPSTEQASPSTEQASPSTEQV
jgi:polyhydroxyalkanoate synthesis regulator phasin